MVDVVVPVYRPDKKLLCLLKRLKMQTVKPHKIILIHTVDSEEEEEWEECVRHLDDVDLVSIRKKDFDHGGTRNIGAFLANSQYVLFMTQDALPAGKGMIEELLKPMEDKNVAVSYARQLAGKAAGPIERYTRNFNYPARSRRKSLSDVNKMGIKTFFCSNVCALYRKETFHKLGGFVSRTIFNEDMIMAHTVIKAGYCVYYAAGAKVVHSHRYTYRQQFRRNFDMAVSRKQYKEVFQEVPPESEGMRLVRDTAGYLLRLGKAYLIPDLILMSAFKYLGYRTGLHYDKLPDKLVRRFSMNPAYWDKQEYFEKDGNSDS